ncbi:MAG: tRNA 2-thiouridine(34) synthase MnmA [candidate division Zixibacteria bacterium]|nr:tRNA 2-thiouridine(34) synthase MnmA [candidate division Zixibacteria bacterium]
MPNLDKQRVVLAMSGGVDSSTAAIILSRDGYEVIGVTMKLWRDDERRWDTAVKSCCSLDSVRDAKYICHKLGIPHYTIDYTEQFKSLVIDNFTDEYFAGKTPNPCIRCNTYMKWGELYRLARQLDAQYIATGHYARIMYDETTGEYSLLKGIDATKDQSYALWGIERKLISRTLLPLGGERKENIRGILKEYGIYFADKAESQEICFIPDNDLEGWLRSKAKEHNLEIPDGDILNENGEIVGRHKGFIHYTIGQRKGLGIAHPRPLYVKRVNSDKNIITVAEDEGLKVRSFTVDRLNWLINEPAAGNVLSFDVKIRYRHKPAPAKCVLNEDGAVEVSFAEPQRAVTPGQSAVFYDSEKVCGGGIIECVS